jgi:hypothetical protein
VTFKVVNQVLLAMFVQKIKPYLSGHRRPLQMEKRVRSFDLAPACSRIEHSLDHRVVVAPQQDVLVQILLLC